MLTQSHVAVIGAGPYGLAAAAHLRGAKIETKVFGRPLDFWKNHMPAGMLLRSSWEASHISDPDQQLTLDRFYAERRIEPKAPVPLDRFVQYGLWFQSRVAPDLDQRQVVRIERGNAGFRLLLDDGESFHSRRVVIAGGIGPFAYRPPLFNGLPSELVSHTGAHSGFGRFSGKQVIVIGGGQSAIECAALLRETGAEVQVVMRAPQVRWLHRRQILRNPSNPLNQLFFPSTDVGPPILNQIAHRPDWFRRLPAGVQPGFAYRCIRPAAAAWLRPRSTGLEIAAGANVISATVAGERIAVKLDNGSSRDADHVFLATGYRVDVHGYKFFAPELIEAVRCHEGYPDLSDGFESSVPGLHFLGAPSARSFGPLMRFVSGTSYSAHSLTQRVLRTARTSVESEKDDGLYSAYRTPRERSFENQ